MPHTESAPSAPSTASTTPLPEPISSTCLPRTFSGSLRSAWISAEVYSLGRSAFTGTRNAMSDPSFIPPPSFLLQALYHDLRHRIVRKLAEHRAISLHGAGMVAPQQRRVRRPGELGQPERLRARLEIGAGAVGAQQLVDRHQAAPSLDRNLVDRTHAEILASLAEGGVADADGGAELLVHALQPRCDVHAVAQHGVAHALARADVADQHGVAMDADPHAQRLVALGPPLRVELLHAALDAQCRHAGAQGMVLEQRRRPPERHHPVAHELVDRAMLLVDR